MGFEPCNYIHGFMLSDRIKNWGLFDFFECSIIEKTRSSFTNKNEELQIINQSLRNNDKVKEDALAHLSDQLLFLTERIQEIERKQSK